MKKIFALCLVLVLLASALCACGASAEEFKCAICQKTVNEVPNDVEYLGAEVKCCETCAESLEAAGDAVEDAMDAAGDMLDALK